MPPAIAIPIAISVGMMAASYAYQRFTQQPMRPGDRDLEATISDTRQYVRTIYGHHKIPLDIIFHEVDPDNSQIWWVVGVIGQGEIESIDSMTFDDRRVIDWENDTGFLAPFGGYINAHRYYGTENQTANPTLVSKFPDQWNTSCWGNGLAYIVLSIDLQKDAFPNGLPGVITVKVKGKKVQDVRDPAWPNSTKIYSNNPANCILDYFVDGRDTHDMVRYGVGAKTTQINAAKWIVEANYCDDLVSVPVNSAPAPALSLISAAGNLDVNANYRYLLVYRNAATGGHTQAGSKSKRIKTTATKLQILLTEIQPNSTPEVTNIDVYRTEGNGSVFKYAGTMANSFTAGELSWEDNVSDASLGATAPSDTTISISTPTQARYTLHGVVTNDADVKDHVEDMLTSCRGNIVFEGGKYRLFIRKTTVPTSFELTPDNIIGDWQFDAPGIDPLVNLAKISFVNPSRKWDTDFVFWPQDRETNRYLAEDAAFENEKSVELYYTTNKNMARQVGQIIRKEARQGLTYSARCNDAAFQLSYGDVVPVTEPSLGWTEKKCWVEGLSIYPHGEVMVSLRDYDDTVYDYDSINVDTVGSADTDLPDPLDAPDEVTNVQFTEELFLDKSVPAWRLKVTFTNPTGMFWSHSEVHLRAGDEADYEYYTKIDKASDGVFYIYPVEALTTYYLKILSVSILGAKKKIDDPDNTIWDYEIIPPIPPTPTNLQIINRGNNSNVYGKDFIFTWRRGSSQGDGNANNSYAQRQTGFVNEDIRYIVEIYYSGIPDNVRVGRTWLRANQMLAYSEIIQHNRYIFSLEDNIEASKTMWEEHAYDANYVDYYGIPQRTVKVRVWAINAWSVKSATYAEIEVTNLAPDMEYVNGNVILPEAYREKSALEFTWPHPWKEYDISRFIGVLATDGQLVNRLESKTVASAVTVWDTDEDVNGVEYTVKFRNLDPKVVYYFAVFPVDVYGKGTRSQIVSNNPAITHDDDNGRITPPGQIGSVTTEVLKNNAGKIKWALLNVDDIKRHIVDWRGVEHLAASSAPGDDEVDQGYLNSDSNKKVLGGHLDIPGDKAYAIVKGLKAGFKYYARVRAENSSEQLGAWSGYATHSATVVGDPADVGDGTITPPKLNLNDIITFLHNGGGGFDFKDSSAARRLTLRAINSGVPLLSIAKAGYDAYNDRDDLNKMLLTTKAKGYLSYIDSGQTSITFDEAASTPTDTETAQDESISLNIAENIVRGVLAFANFSIGSRDFMIPLNGFQDFTTAGKTLQFFFAYDSTDATHLLKVRRWIKNNSGGDWTVPSLTIKVNWYVLGETLLKS